MSVEEIENDEDLEFLVAYEFSTNFDNREITLTIKSSESFNGLRLEATLKSFLEGFANDFDDLLDDDKNLN